MPARPPAPPIPTPTPLPAAASLDTKPFVWAHHWWPLVPVENLKPDRPNPIMLLGMPLVVWRDGSGAWRVFKDACPHRLAPLSGVCTVCQEGGDAISSYEAVRVHRVRALVWLRW